MKVSFFFFGTFKILKDQLEMQFSTPKNDKKFETPLGVEVLWWGGGCEKMVTWGYISGPGMFLFKALLRDDRSIKNRVLNEICGFFFWKKALGCLFLQLPGTTQQKCQEEKQLRLEEEVRRQQKRRSLVTPLWRIRGGILPSFAHTKDGEDKGKPQKSWNWGILTWGLAWNSLKPTRFRMHMA